VLLDMLSTGSYSMRQAASSLGVGPRCASWPGGFDPAEAQPRHYRRRGAGQPWHAMPEAEGDDSASGAAPVMFPITDRHAAGGAAVSASVVVPCRNEAAYIEVCVRGILQQVPPAGGFEVIVADGMSDDGSREILERLGRGDERVRVVENPSGIVSTGLNAAIRAARGAVIVRMDAHTDYAPDYLRQCLAVLEETGADNVGGPWVAKGDGYVGRAVAAAFQSPFAVGGARGHDPRHAGEVDTVYLGCWRRETFDWIGLFDEELVRNQDDELNLRLIRSGGRIWQSPRIRSHYRPRRSLGGLWRQYMQYGYWKVRVVQKHRMPASVRHFVPGVFVTALAALALASTASSLARMTLVAVATTYFGAVGLASVLTAARGGWNLLPVLPAVFACYHLAYGVGFLRGVVDFLLLRRGPPPALVALTRGSAVGSRRAPGKGATASNGRPLRGEPSR
jgi:succinoglycan biosynthesis protein ExoA